MEGGREEGGGGGRGGEMVGSSGGSWLRGWDADVRWTWEEGCTDIAAHVGDGEGWMFYMSLGKSLGRSC